PPLVGPPPVGPFPPPTASAIMLPPAPKSESSDDPASSSVLLQATRQGVAKATIESRGGSDFIDAVYHARESTRRTHLEVRGIEFKTPHGVVIAQVCVNKGDSQTSRSIQGYLAPGRRSLPERSERVALPLR